jgi:hypothetical protein
MLTVSRAENRLLPDPNNAEYRVMSPASFTPEQDLHFVLCARRRLAELVELRTYALGLKKRSIPHLGSAQN